MSKQMQVTPSATQNTAPIVKDYRNLKQSGTVFAVCGSLNFEHLR